MDSKYHFGETGAGELIPGAAPRRWLPEQGLKKHNDRIHRENGSTTGADLPYTFSALPKPLSGRPNLVKCDNCGHLIGVSTATVGVICSNCKKFSTVTEV